MSDYTRITGLASGMDTENMIKDLMKAESQKKIKVEKEKQIIEWEKESYQDISKMLTEYKNTNFDVLTPETNFRSPTMFSDFSTNITVNGSESSAVSVTGNSEISKLSYTINSITQLATKDTYESASRLKETIDGRAQIDVSRIGTINSSIASGNDTFVITFDGESKSITLDGGYRTDTDANGKADLLTDLQSKIDEAFGAGKINIDYNASADLFLSGAEAGHQTSINASDAGILSYLGFSSGDSDYFKGTDKIGSVFDVTGDINFEINGVGDFNISSNDTIDEMIEKVNSSDAGVTMSYSELSGKISIQSNEYGKVNKISFSDTDNFLANELEIDVTGALGYTEAKDAVFTIDGTTTSRSSNSFTIDGATFKLNQTSAEAIDVNLSPDTDGLVEKITSFVDKYNNIIETINEKLDETRNYDYQPLSDDDKEAMTDEEIELWEAEAKKGLLSSSNELQSIATRMRTLIYEPIEGLDISLKDIGITTSSNYKENGKLIIDEDQLSESINNSYSKVVELFTKSSEIEYSDIENRSQRTSESGIANRIYDVLQDYIRKTRDDNGNKGILLEKAGVAGDVTEFDNSMNEKIEKYDDRIDELIDYLNDREDYYYRMFAQMEKAMAEMQTQASWLQGNMG